MVTAARDRLARTLRGDAETAVSVGFTARTTGVRSSDRRATIAYHGWQRLSGLYLRSCWRARGN
jgi:hypothetical protein